MSYTIIEPPVDREWATWIKSCYVYNDHILSSLPDHLLLRDSDDLINAKEKAAEEAFLKIEKKIVEEQLYQNKTQKYNREMGISTGSGDESSYDTYFDIRVDHEQADENGNYGGIVNDHKSPDISDLCKFSHALPNVIHSHSI